MDGGKLGLVLEPGETLFRQGDQGDRMFVIQEGCVEIVVGEAGRSVTVARRTAGEYVGEMALFEREVRMATVRAVERTRVLSVDRKNLLQRIHDDPSLAYRLIQSLSQRLRQATQEVARLTRVGSGTD